MMKLLGSVKNYGHPVESVLGVDLLHGRNGPLVEEAASHDED